MSAAAVPPVGPRLRTVMQAGHTLWWVLRTVRRAAPGLAWADTALTVVLMLAPGVGVLATATLLQALSQSAPDTRGAPLLAEVAGPVAWVLGSVALSGPLSSAAATVRRRLTDVLRAELRTRLACQVARTPLVELADDEAAARVAAADAGIEAHLTWQYHEGVLLLQNAVAALGVVAAVWGIDWRAGALVAAALVPVVLAALQVGRHVEAAEEASAPLRARERYLLAQLVGKRSAVELASLGTASRLAQGVADSWRGMDEQVARVLRPQLVTGTASGLVTAGLLAGALAAVITGTRYGAGAAAGIVGVISALGAVAGVGAGAAGILTAAVPAARVRAFLARELPSREHRVHAPVQKLQVRGATFTFDGTEEPVLGGVDLLARRGEVVALVGRNGAGKTTLVNAVLGLLVLQAGSVCIDGVDLDTLEEGERLGYFGLLSQDYGRYEVTVREAVTLGSPDGQAVSDEAVWQALRRAGADGFVADTAGGLDQQLGEQFGGVGLSGGQWQRLALARIHLRGAPVWVLDEPTSSVDAESEAVIFGELGRSRGERVTVVVSHRAWTLRGVDRIYVLDAGRVVQVGTFAELAGGGGLFAELFREQLVGDARDR